MINKTDRNDARGIAQMMRTDWFQPVHVKTTESHELRFLLVARKLLLKQQYEIESCIRGSLKVFGLKIGVITKRMFEARVRELIDERSLLVTIVEPLLRARTLIVAEHNRLYRMIVRLVQRDPVCRRLTSVPGVGALVALTYRTGIDVPARFLRSKAVGAHLGLTPRKHQSGEVDRTGHISKWDSIDQPYFAGRGLSVTFSEAAYRSQESYPCPLHFFPISTVPISTV
jgi:transposase